MGGGGSSSTVLMGATALFKIQGIMKMIESVVKPIFLNFREINELITTG